MLRERTLAGLLFLVAGSCGVSSAQTYNNAELLNEAGQAYNSDQCVRAGRFAFAYLLRNPTADSTLRGNLQTIISWCEQHTSVASGSKGDGTSEATDSRPAIKLGAPGPDPARSGATVVVPAPPPHPRNSTEKRCYLYATLAVAQNRLNEGNGCNFSGSRWDSDYNYHYNWCLSAPAAETKSESSTRLSMLNQCAP